MNGRKAMRFITISTFAILATLSLGTADAQTLYTCGEGSVRTVRVITEMVTQPPVVVTIDPLGEPQQLVERAPDKALQAILVTVQLFNAMYTGEAFTANPENFDPTELQEDETIATCVDRDQLILNRGDGREFRARIVRSDRVSRPLGTR
jgi:hypothetical protein